MRENAHFKGNENGRRAITAHPVAPRAKFAQAAIEPHGIESGTKQAAAPALHGERRR
jgi:hypothetical protein